VLLCVLLCCGVVLVDAVVVCCLLLEVVTVCCLLLGVLLFGLLLSFLLHSHYFTMKLQRGQLLTLWEIDQTTRCIDCTFLNNLLLDQR